MKFPLKIFFSTIIVISVTFGIGGYLLISSLFDSALTRELDAAGKEHKMMCFSIETASSLLGLDADSESPVRDSLITIGERMTSDGSLVRISNRDMDLIYETKPAEIDQKLLEFLSLEKDSYTVQKVKDNYYIQYASQIQISSETIYVESYKEITPVFLDRIYQFETFQRLMIGLLIINGIIIFALAIWITRPIQKLSRATKKIADGQYGERAVINSKDEIGMLATDFNKMADALEKKIHALEDASKRQEDFIASFAHELKTPLTSVIGYADMIRSKELTKDVNFMAGNYIFHEGKRLESLSLKLLDLIVMQKKDIKRKRMNAKALLSEAAAFMEPILRNGEITFQLQAESFQIYVEPDLIKTLFFNLLDNSRKAVNGHGEIILTGRKKPEGYEIIVKDSGRGIPEDDIERITEAFYMVDKSRAREEGGAGLGLSICMEIVKLHDGTMTFKSNPGEGTTVTVFLKNYSGDRNDGLE